MIKAVLFDLDGTLADSLADLADSTDYALSVLGFPTHNLNEYKYFVGDGIPKLIERALPSDKKSPEIQKRCLDIFMEHYREHYHDKTRATTALRNCYVPLKKQDLKRR